MATGSRADRDGRARPPGAEVDRGHGVRVEVGHQRDALAAGAARAPPRPRRARRPRRPSARRRGWPVSISCSCRPPGSRRATRRRPARRPAPRAGCPPAPWPRRGGGTGVTGVTSMPGSVTEAPVVDPGHVVHRGAADRRVPSTPPAGGSTPPASARRAASAAADRTVRLSPRAHAAPAGRSDRAPPAGVALGPEVAGDVVLHVGHRRRRAGRQDAQRVEQRVDVVVGGAEPAAGPHGARNGAAVAAVHGGPRLVDARRGRRRAGGSGRGARRSSRAARRSRTPRSGGPPPGRGASRPR